MSLTEDEVQTLRDLADKSKQESKQKSEQKLASEDVDFDGEFKNTEGFANTLENTPGRFFEAPFSTLERLPGRLMNNAVWLVGSAFGVARKGFNLAGEMMGTHKS